MTQQKNQPWWSEDYGFFGQFYMEGDDSKEGYLVGNKQTLDQRTSAEVDGVIKLLALEKPARILDCPCGYGRHAVELSKRGFNVTGSDLNSTHLQKAAGSAKAAGVGMELNKESMIDLDYNSEFDAVINMFYSFGFFDTDEENEKVLRNFYKALKPGGKFLFHTDVNLPRVLLGHYKEVEDRVLSKNNMLKIVDKYDPATKRINGSWTIDGVTKDYSVRVYSKEEFEGLCKKVGFSEAISYSDWQGRLYFEGSEDMIVVAIK